MASWSGWGGGGPAAASQQDPWGTYQSGSGRGGAWDSWAAAPADAWAPNVVEDPWSEGQAVSASKSPPAPDVADKWGAWTTSGSGGGGGSEQWGAEAQGTDSWGGGGGDWDKPLGENLSRSIEWHNIRLVEVDKNFYEEHHNVTRRTEEEVERIRREKDIEVLSDDKEYPVPKPVVNFEEASMPDWLLAGVKRKGFTSPTAIQVQVWPVALQGRDLIGIAETGSGKTLAYLLPMMIHIMAQEELKANEGPIGMVLCPTRELALQIDGVAKEFIGPSGLKSTCVYGGSQVKEQGAALKEKNDIVVATPGRFIQLLNDGWTNLNRVTYVVLDEADEMLNKGFEEQIKLILSQVRPDRQMLMFSATWPKDVQELGKTQCRQDPVTVRIGGDRLAACRTINQKILVLPDGCKFEKLMEAIVRSGCNNRGSLHKCLIFCRTKANVNDLVWRLEANNVEVYGFHSDKTQDERIRNLHEFKDGECSCLVATNCLGRGHDIPRVRYVINYDAPEQIENYIHRIGRTGRAGESGFAMTFLTERDRSLAPFLVSVLQETKQPVPAQLQELADSAGRSDGWLGTSIHGSWGDQAGGDSQQGVGGGTGGGWATSGGWNSQ